MTKLVEKVADAIEGQMSSDENHPDDLARAAIEAVFAWLEEPRKAVWQAIYENRSEEYTTDDIYAAMLTQLRAEALTKPSERVS